MKKLLLTPLIIVVVITSSFAAGNEYFDLKAYDSGWGKGSNYLGFAWAFYNHSTYTVRISDFRIVAYLYSTKTASEHATNNSSGQGAVYNSSGTYIRGVSQAWAVTFSNVTASDCGINCGVNRRANIKCIFTYPGTEVVESGYRYHTNGTNVWVNVRYNDWSTMDKTDDFSNMEDDTCVGSSIEGTEWKYLVLEYNDGSGWRQICERTDSSGTTDTESGVYPCSTSACSTGSTPTITQTVTPTITRTATPTITRTITSTITQTITQTITSTITPTATPTVTLTITSIPTPDAILQPTNFNLLFQWLWR